MPHHRLIANGIGLHVAELGEGPAVLFCHGFPAIGASWLAQMQAVAAAGYRALAPDMRGYGRSDAPAAAEAYTPFQTVGDLVGILDRLAIPEAVVVGHDFGASVAWNAAMMRPDRFRAVLGISVPFIQPGGPTFLDAIRASGRTGFYMFDQMRPEADGLWADAAVTIPGNLYWTSGQAPEATRWDPFDPARGLLRPAPEPLRGIDPDYVGEAVASFSRTGFHGALNYYRAIDPFYAVASGVYSGAIIRQPSSFLTGARDGLNAVRLPTEEGMRKALKDLRGFEIVPEAGHWPQLETPAAVNAALLRFLATLR
ncbi:alpha/beta hydrolase [Pararoseomonas sp. SCSIO 73927]|uniref:alpha/beta fold hydrolase n=1 Tax=Pararoseomonas sp. SCSIO 73927 TaxID=3114537 RepID=UPI0030CA8F1B